MEKGTTSTPHDAVFKQFLRHADTARDFLDIHLPPALRKMCDLDTLTLASGSFIEENLRAYYSDVLWALKTAAGEGYIYVVIEHQSSPDAFMAFRLMRYAIAAMQRHLDNGHKTLPLVIPILFYHGVATPYPGRYPGSTCSPTQPRQNSFIPDHFRWWILPSYLMTKLCSIEESPCWS